MVNTLTVSTRVQLRVIKHVTKAVNRLMVYVSRHEDVLAQNNILVACTMQFDKVVLAEFSNKADLGGFPERVEKSFNS